jgi:signal transduction histidine kinase
LGPLDFVLELAEILTSLRPSVAKYSQATAASVSLSRTGRGVAIEIADDGVGGADASGGSGLRGLADRVEALGGHLLVTSPAGAGTVVTADLPMPGLECRPDALTDRAEQVGDHTQRSRAPGSARRAIANARAVGFA